MKCRKQILAGAAAAWWAVSAGEIRAGDGWTQWRGPARDGRADVEMPKPLPDAPTHVWRVEVGEGHASPLVANGKVYVFARLDDRETATCLDLATGKVVWQTHYGAPYEMNSAARRHGKGPKSTPVFHGGRLYTLGISGILSCFDGETGEAVWRKTWEGRFDGALPLYGTAMSPVVAAGMVIAHVGGHDNGALVALDAGTGEERWAWAGEGPGYASPVVATLDHVPQVVTQTQGSVVGIGLETGALLWQVGYTTAWDQNSVTPVVSGEQVIVSGLRKGASAYRPKRGEDGWTVHRTWHNSDASMYMSSPVLADGYLYGLSHIDKGRFFCLQASTGDYAWRSDGRQADQALLSQTEGYVIALTDGAEMILFVKSSEGFDVAKRYSVADSPTWAAPAFVDGHVLVKDERHLNLWRME